MATKTDKVAIKILEAQFKAVIREAGFDCFMKALSNACDQGAAFDCVTDEDLNEIHSHIDKMIKISKRVY